MKLARQVKLFYQEGTSDKVYEIDLCESGDGYLVNFRYGRRGAALKEGTKTVFPIPLNEAEKVFQALEQEKRKKGYVAAGEAAIVTSEEKSTSSGTDKRKKTIVKMLRAAANGEEPEHWPLSRIIWRAGELKITEAIPHIIKVADDTDPANIHSVIWAIGRCGTSDAVGFLQSLQQKPSIAIHTRELLTDALLKLSSPKEVEVMKTALLATLSSTLRESVASGDASKLDKALRELLFELKTSTNDFLVDVYRLVRDNRKMKSAFLKVLPEIKLVVNNFRAIRRIFKSAEMLEDYATYGVIAKQIEKQPFGYKVTYYMKPEVKKTLGFSNKTKGYLMDRVIRQLRKLGNAGNESYSALAAGILLAFDPTDAIQPHHESKYDWVYNALTKRHDPLETRTYYDSYSNYSALNFILHRNSKRYKQIGKAWACVDPYKPGQKGPLDREEAYPALWNDAAIDVIQLLAHTRVDIIMEFAMKVWSANPSFEKEITTEDLVQFFDSPFAAVQALGLSIAASRYDRSNPDYGLLLAMLGSPLQDARRQVDMWLLGEQTKVAANTEFMVSLFQLQRPEAHEWIRKFFSSHGFDTKHAELIIAKVIAGVMTSPVSTPEEIAHMTLLGDTFVALFKNELSKINLAIIQDLFRHSSAEVHTLAGKILHTHNVRPEELPPGFLQLMLQSPNSGTRSMGISLLAKFPEDQLLDKQELLVSFCLSPLADVRAAARPAILKLAKAYPKFGTDLIDLFVPAILMKESYEGVHDDIVALLSSEEMSASLATIPQEKALKLVASRFRAPQKLGVVLVKRNVKFSDLTVPQLVKLADNPVEEVRHLAYQEFRANPAKMKYFVEDALRITDSDWDETRHFAFDYFREQFTATDWTPELLILLCDSVRDDVQDFGREMITKFFDPKHGTEYLLKLSQHPSTRVQLFATAYLEQFASGKVEMIETLKSYFVTLLSQVNKGRTAKKRVMHFLRTESLRDEKVARIAADIFARLSVTVAISERAECIAALRDIQQKFQSIQSPVKLKSAGDYINS